MVDSVHSAIHVLSQQDIKDMEGQEVQDIFHKQHVLVQDQFKPKLAFDEEGLKTLADLKKPVTL
jgi:hypothetical protein